MVWLVSVALFIAPLRISAVDLGGWGKRWREENLEKQFVRKGRGAVMRYND